MAKQKTLDVGLDQGIRIKFTKLVPKSHRKQITENMIWVQRYFPEFDGRMFTVGHIHDDTGVSGRASLSELKIWIRKDSPLFTIAHEFTHLLQRANQYKIHFEDNIPFGEKSCDIWTLARSYEYIDCINLYMRLPKGMDEENSDDWKEILHHVAKDSIKERKNGRKQYIKWWENKIREIYEQEVEK